jgi:hypothetical protein
MPVDAMLRNEFALRGEIEGGYIGIVFNFSGSNASMAASSATYRPTPERLFGSASCRGVCKQGEYE